MMRFLALATAAALVLSLHQSAPSPTTDSCSPTAAELKAWTVELRHAHTDDAGFLRALDARVRGDLKVLSTGVDAADTATMNLWVIPRYIAYRRALSEALRKMDPIDQLEPPPGFIVSVEPLRIDAPDIVKLVVQRDGQIVLPIAGELQLHTLSTTLGAARQLHAGDVVFPCSAFRPGATVTVTAIPATGENLVKRLDPADLVIMR